MTDKLRVALIGGPMYDALYEGFIDDVEVIVHADHLTLNAQVAALVAAGERLDVISTHGKYAPSQRRWLYPLDDLLAPSTIAALEPGAVSLCRDRGDLLCAPRNIDVRVLWWRIDRMADAPETFVDLIERDIVFGFTGHGSGLFGLFYELVVGAGGRLFDNEGRAALARPHAERALEMIAVLGARCPSGPHGITSWQYDAVDDALSTGIVDCAALWPGATGLVRTSDLADLLRPAAYPAGPERSVSYSGCHGWAIPKTCGDLEGAIQLVELLCSPSVHEVEASLGGIPARSSVLEAIEPLDGIDAARLDVTRATIANSMITYPPLERFPLIEGAASGAITAVLSGDQTIAEAAATIDRTLERAAS